MIILLALVRFTFSMNHDVGCHGPLRVVLLVSCPRVVAPGGFR